ncbi:MAG: hypothetical protein ACLQMT_13405, partial [Candidatus Acidiferrales bacterium]
GEGGLRDAAEGVVVERGGVAIRIRDASLRKIETRTLARTARDAAPSKTLSLIRRVCHPPSGVFSFSCCRLFSTSSRIGTVRRSTAPEIL